MTHLTVDDARSSDPVERLLEDSWHTRSRHVSRRELLVEATATVLFLCCAVPLALAALASHRLDVPLAALLVVLYALASRLIKFPIGAGYVVPSYLVLVPMLLLLPPGIAPLLTAISLVLGTLAQVAAKRERPRASAARDTRRVACARTGRRAGAHRTAHAGIPLPMVYIAAFIAGGLLDLVSATVRESAILGVASRVQLRVLALVWLIDACVAPLGLLVASAARHDPAKVLYILPLTGLLFLLSRDRNARIAEAQRRLGLVVHERSRLQRAVGRLGEALAAKLDLEALTDIVLRDSVEALDADAGRLILSGPLEPRVVEIADSPRVAPALRVATKKTQVDGEACQLQRDGVWALALPFGICAQEGKAVLGERSGARCPDRHHPSEAAVAQGPLECGSAAVPLRRSPPRHVGRPARRARACRRAPRRRQGGPSSRSRVH